MYESTTSADEPAPGYDPVSHICRKTYEVEEGVHIGIKDGVKMSSESYDHVKYRDEVSRRWKEERRREDMSGECIASVVAK